MWRLTQRISVPTFKGIHWKLGAVAISMKILWKFIKNQKIQISKFWKEQSLGTDPGNKYNYFQKNLIGNVGEVTIWKSWRTLPDAGHWTPDNSVSDKLRLTKVSGAKKKFLRKFIKNQHSEKNKVWGLTQEISVPSFKRIHWNMYRRISNLKKLTPDAGHLGIR